MRLRKVETRQGKSKPTDSARNPLKEDSEVRSDVIESRRDGQVNPQSKASTT